jgi:hypothetical protein
MYGFSGYATNEYGASRSFGVVGPVIKFLSQTLQSGYGVVNALLLQFSATTITLEL